MASVCVFLIESDGLKGRTVVERFLSSVDYPDIDLRVVVDGPEGDAVQTMDRLRIPYTVASDPAAPSDAIERVTSDADEIRYLITCGWIHKIPSEARAMATDAINCHSSYLPDYKGRSTYRPQWAHAELEGGATVHFLTEEFDEGAIICQDRFVISTWDSPLDIAYKYSDITTPLVREAMLLLSSGYEGVPHEGGRYYSVIPWPTTLAHGIVNHVSRGVGSEWRWEIEPA